MVQPVDTLFIHAHLMTMTGDGVGYVADGAVAVAGSHIVATGTTGEVVGQVTAAETIDATGSVLMPGLIDAHIHTPWAAVRGVAQDVNNWMQQGLAPYARHMTPEAAHAGTQLNLVEGIRAGTTTFGDFVRPAEGWAQLFVDAGVRGRLTPTINALPPTGMAGWKVGEIYPLDDAAGQASIDAAVAFARTWHGTADGRITAMLGPQGPDMINKDQLLEVKRLADRDGLMIHLHTAQGDREIDQMVKRYGVRTPDYLKSIGYLDDQLLAVHLTEATDAETQMIASTGAAMALCSGSIAIIDGIVPPAHVFRQAGGAVALGSDQAAGNNCNSMFNEMKLTSLFNKIKFRDPTIMPAWEVMRMATIEGATAIGLAGEIGSIEVGKRADLIMINVATSPNLLPALQQPIRTVVPNLVFAATGNEVTHSMVDGQFLMRDRELLSIDANAVCDEVQLQAERVAAAVAADPIHQDLALLRAMKAGQL